MRHLGIRSSGIQFDSFVILLKTSLEFIVTVLRLCVRCSHCVSSCFIFVALVLSVSIQFYCDGLHLCVSRSSVQLPWVSLCACNLCLILPVTPYCLLWFLLPPVVLELLAFSLLFSPLIHGLKLLPVDLLHLQQRFIFIFILACLLACFGVLIHHTGEPLPIFTSLRKPAFSFGTIYFSSLLLPQPNIVWHVALLKSLSLNICYCE